MKQYCYLALCYCHRRPSQETLGSIAIAIIRSNIPASWTGDFLDLQYKGQGDTPGQHKSKSNRHAAPTKGGTVIIVYEGEGLNISEIIIVSEYFKACLTDYIIID